MKIADALREAELLAQTNRIPAADYLYLLSDLTGLNPVELKLERMRELNSSREELWRAYCKRRTEGEPSQYITGKAYFYGLELQVSPGVLIPRPETEGLVELALRHSQPARSALDIGTGSGAIALALKSCRPELFVTATDISVHSIDIAKQNAKALGLEINFVEADLFPVPEQRFDLIISNPPYISRADYDLLPVHIRCHEPESALLAAEDGLIFYRRILENLPRVANPGACVCFEIGSGQAAPIKAIAKNLGLDKIDIMVDSAALDRYVLIKI